jgi:Phage major capsid protein E
MPYDIFSTSTLNGVVQSLFVTPTFLVDRYFPNVQQDQVEEIHFDVLKFSRRISPFVSPLVEGKIVETLGYTTATFKPAYVKDKRVFDGNRPLRRTAGERIGGQMTPAERMASLVAMEAQDQINMLHRRLEVMAGEILTTGKVTITGDRYPTVVVDYGRDATLTQALVGGARWGQAGVDPLANLEAWALLVLNKVGANAIDVIMTPDAWQLFQTSATVLRFLDRFRGNSTLQPMETTSDEGAKAMGNIYGFNIWVYNGHYYDDVSAADKVILPPYTVLLMSSQIEGYQAYGAIRDEQAGFQATPFFAKSWIEEDPPVRYMMLQSAPLLVPYRPNAMIATTVN